MRTRSQAVDVPDYRFTLHPTWDATCRIYAQTSIDPSVHIGPHTTIWRYVTILEGCIIGEDVMIADCVSLGRRVCIGAGSRIQHGTALPDDTQIGARVFLGSNVSLTDVVYPSLQARQQEQHRPPVVEDEVVIGCNAVILPGVVLHRGAVIGAGSVVTRDVAAGMIVAGNPARVLPRSRRPMLMNEAGDLLHHG